MSWDTASRLLNHGVTRAFGERVVYTPAGGQPMKLKGVFEQDPKTLLLDRGDLPGEPSKHDVVQVGGTKYRVIGHQVDGAGGLTLRLAAA